jgi:hypothetical protein
VESRVLQDSTTKEIKGSKRFATLDFARGIAIFLMIGFHTLSFVLNITDLLADIDNLRVINLVALVLLPFYGGLAGFFLIVSATSNMVSMYKDLEKKNSVRSIVMKQVVGGLLLLIFAMLCEGLIGYHGAFGNFFRFLDDPGRFFDYNPLSNYEHWGGVVDYNWQVLLWRWNHFETIHTIAWCLIINGCVQGLLSLKNNWQNRKRMVISYAILAIVVVGLTQPVWLLVKKIVPGYPFELIPVTGNVSFTPILGEDRWWRIFTAPFLNVLAAPMEPLFPYLAVSFIGSIIGILISQPKEKINKNMPRNMFLVGLGMFIPGMIGVVIIIVKLLGSLGFEDAVGLYQLLPYHRHWSSDYASYIPMFAWLAQFLCLTGYSVMLIMFLFRLIEFRGKSKAFSDKARFVRRFGTVAFSNYNNQWIYYIMFFLMSLAINQAAYERLFWAGTFLTIFVTLLVYYLLLLGWERIKYIGSLEWIIRTFTNNVIPVRRKKFDPSVKWWQRGQIDVERTFYHPEWIDLNNPEEVNEAEEHSEAVIDKQPSEERESKLALILSIVGLITIIFNAVSIFGLFISLNARKTDGINKRNKAALIMSIIGCVLFTGFYVFCLSVKVETLGIPL